MTAVVQTSPSLQFDIGALDQVGLAVDASPQATLLQWMIDAVGPMRFADAVKSVRHRIRPSARFGLAPLSDHSTHYVPDCTMPIDPGQGASVAEQIEMLRSCPVDRLFRELDELWDESTLPAAWRVAADDAPRWFDSFADACTDSWTIVAPAWNRAAPIVDREVRRIGAAAVTGGLDALLNSLHPRLSYADGALTIVGSCGARSSLDSRKLVLVPMLADPGRLYLNLESLDVAYIGYSAPRPRGSTAGDGGTQREDALTLVLGPIRAAAIRALAKPRTMTTLARLLRCAPSTATYHCDQLVAAGLVVRERRGPAIWISRTDRAAELEALLAV